MNNQVKEDKKIIEKEVFLENIDAAIDLLIAEKNDLSFSIESMPESGDEPEVFVKFNDGTLNICNFNTTYDIRKNISPDGCMYIIKPNENIVQYTATLIVHMFYKSVLKCPAFAETLKAVLQNPEDVVLRSDLKRQISDRFNTPYYGRVLSESYCCESFYKSMIEGSKSNFFRSILSF